MKSKRTLILFLAAIVVSSALAMTSCSSADGSTGNNGNKSSNEAPPSSVNVEESGDSETAEVDSEYVSDETMPEITDESGIVTDGETEPIYYDDPIPDTAIENDRFEFKYFEEWSEHVRFETKDSDGRYEILCYGVGDIEGIHCFSIIFADCNGLEDHYYMGDLNSTPVYTYVNQDFSSLNEDQIDLINETVLSYYMNELTYQLKDAEGFVTGR